MQKNLEQRLRDVQHFGEEGGVVPDIDLAATSTFLDPVDMEKSFSGEKQGCYLYSRHSNPTVNMFSIKMAALEATPAAIGVASGMSAISSTLEQLLPEGGEILSSLTVYGGTYALLKNIFPRQGIHTKFVDIHNLKAVEEAITEQTRVIYTETLSNPLLNLSPLADLADLAHRRGLKLVVDNTFAPCLVTPALLGADVVVHSCTKFISGASDMVAGAICGSEEFISSLRDLNHGVVMLKGGVMDPRLAYELYVRLDHLPIRMKAHSRVALNLAERLVGQGVPVIYPGLQTHPHHQKMSQILNSGFGYGGMMAIEFADASSAMRVARELQSEVFGLYAVSLGFSRTLMTVPAVTTSSEISSEDQKKMNLKQGLLRLSIGYLGDEEEMFHRFMEGYRKHIRD